MSRSSVRNDHDSTREADSPVQWWPGPAGSASAGRPRCCGTARPARRRTAAGGATRVVPVPGRRRAHRPGVGGSPGSAQRRQPASRCGTGEDELPATRSSNGCAAARPGRHARISPRSPNLMSSLSLSVVCLVRGRKAHLVKEEPLSVREWARLREPGSALRRSACGLCCRV